MTARRPHVLIMVENLPLAIDQRLRKQVPALVAAGLEVSVITPRHPDNARFDGVRVYEYRAAPASPSKLGFVREYLQAWVMTAVLTGRALLTAGFDAVQTCCPPDTYFPITAPLRLLGKLIVVDLRDLSPDLYEARYGQAGGRTYRVLEWLERASLRTAHHVITVNQSLVDLICRRGGLPRERVTVVGNGPVLGQTRERPPRPELKQGRRYLCCFMGVMGPQDRVEQALLAIHQLIRDRGRTDCHFTFLGAGDSKAAAERQAVELGLQDHVTFTGWVGQDLAFDYLSTADLGIEPNLEEIVSPVKAMEYMAFRLPFVAFDLKETRALAETAAAYARPGDVADFARLIDELLDDAERRAEMGRVGRRRIEDEVAWDHQERAYLEVLYRLLNRAGPDRVRALATRRTGGPR